MRDLVELTDQELTDLTAKQRLRLVSAGVILAACAVLSLRSIVALFVDPSVPSLPGMAHPVGQVAWAGGLVAMMCAVTWLVRGVLRRRLQWALAVSVLLHFLLCLSVSTVDFSGRDTQQSDAAAAMRRDEWSLPDYAMSESADTQPAWAQPNDTQTPDNEAEAERMRAQIVQASRTEIDEPVRKEEVTEASHPERQEHLAMASEAAPELVRSELLKDSPPETPKSIEMPAVESAEDANREPELEATQMDRADSSLPQLERSKVDRAVAATESEMTAATPEALRRDASAALESENASINQPKRDSAVRPASSTAEAPERLPEIETAASPQAVARERRVENARRQSELAEQRSSSPMPRSRLADSRPSKAALPNNRTPELANAARSNLPDGGAAAMARKTASAPSVEATNIEDVSVAQASRRSTDTARAANAAPAASSNRRSSSKLTFERSNQPSESQLASSGADAPSASGIASTNRRATGERRPVVGETGDRFAGTPMNARSDRAGSSSDGSSVTSGLSTTVADGGDVPTTRSAGRSNGRTSISSTAGSNGSGSESDDGDAASGLIAGPAAGGVGRRAKAAAPTSERGESGTGSSSGVSNAGTDNGEDIAAVTSGLAGGREGVASGRDANARLGASDGFADRGGALNFGRTGSGNGLDLSGLPSGALGAERSGALTMAGPQPSGTSDEAGGSAGNSVGSSDGARGQSGGKSNGKGTALAGLAGPRSTGIGRHSAGLPGSSSPSGSGPSGSLVSASSEEGSTPKASLIGSPRRGAGTDRPTLSTGESSIAGLLKRSAAVTGGSATAAMPERLSLRTADGRREAATSLGGSKESEDAVERGLEWLSRNQHPDGHWAIHDFPGEDDRNVGNFESNTAATGLAMLSFLGAGYTHESGKYQNVVKRGMQWLIVNQKPDGNLYPDQSEFVQFYSHGIAAIAFCEAYGMTKDATLKDPSQRALNFIVASQHPEFGGWRYLPRFESDTSVSGWQLMALKSGEVAGLEVPSASYQLVGKWLDSVERPGGQYSYHPTRDAGLAMTAEGLLMRQYLGAKRDDPILMTGARFLSTRPPNFGERDAYYWYYATQVMFHMQGELWQEWNNAMRDTLVNNQELAGNDRGSWDPTKPAPEKWSAAGGRHYLTCLNLLMLEVYYRHLPLYAELGK